MEMRSNVAPKDLDRWEAELNAPLPTSGSAGSVDESVLATLVEIGQAVDLVDAADVFAHQQALSKISDIDTRLLTDQRFRADRVERLRARGAIPDPGG
jgi:hypothetical protein